MPRKERMGVVVSDKMDKTRVVLVTQKKRHDKYGKVQTWTKRYKVHDPQNTAQTGDMVRIIESRPISKDKCWALVEVVKHTEEV